VQQDVPAEYRRPGRPKGSRDRAPRTKNTKRVSIRHIDSSLDESRALELRTGDQTNVFENKEVVKEMSCNSASQECSNSGKTVPFFIESFQDDPFRADWPFW
jgi:hypothetical protein